MSKEKNVKELLKLFESFLIDGRSFCFQSQSKSDYFNVSLASHPDTRKQSTQYDHATSLEEMLVKLKYMVENSKGVEKVKPKPAMPTPPGFPMP